MNLWRGLSLSFFFFSLLRRIRVHSVHFSSIRYNYTLYCVYLGKRIRTKVEWHPNFWGRVDHLHLRHTPEKILEGITSKRQRQSRNVYLHSKMYNRLCSSYHNNLGWFFSFCSFNHKFEKHDHHTELPFFYVFMQEDQRLRLCRKWQGRN